MRSFVIYPLAFLAASWTAAAFPFNEVRFTELAELQARQAPGTPEYQCHADCGYAILGADEANYCTNSTWLGLLDDCLECANKFNIWRYYGNGVTGAAKGCGLDAVPSPSGGGSAPPSSTAAPPTSAPETTGPAPTSAPPAQSTEQPTSAPGGEQPSSSAPPAETSGGAGGSQPNSSQTYSGSAAPTEPPSTTASGVASGTGTVPSSGAPTSSFVSVSGGMKVIPSVVALGLSVLVLAF